MPTKKSMWVIFGILVISAWVLGPAIQVGVETMNCKFYSGLLEAGEVSMLYGSGKYTYKLVDEWAKLPQGWTFTDGAGITIDSSDKVYILSRGTHPVTIWNRDGNLLGNWGEFIQAGSRGDFWS